MARAHDQLARKVLHVAMGAFALALRYLTWWQTAALAAAAILFNLLVLPRLAGHLFRPAERAGSATSGIVLYPAAVLLLVLVFRDRLDIAAAAWAILAVGDGMATIAGVAIRSRPLPWNRSKSIAGTTAFVVCGSLAGAAVAWWCRPNVTPPPEIWFSVAAPVVAAVVAALFESIPIRLDDNLSVSGAAGGTLWALSLAEADLVGPALAAAAHALAAAAAANVIVGWLGHRARTVTLAGAVTGVLIGVAIGVTTGWPGWVLLLATFLSAAISSRLGLRRKTLLGIAEERGGRRGAGNALANTGLAAAASLLSVVMHDSGVAVVAFVTALAAAGSDTIASEIGKAWGKRTYLVTNLRRVPPGTSGAVSIEGTLAGIAGAAILASVAAGVGLIYPSAIVAVVAGATIGSAVESVLGATLEAPGILNNDMLNFLNTAVATGAGVVIFLAGS